MNGTHAPVRPKPHVLLVSDIGDKFAVRFIQRHEARAMCKRGRFELIERKAKEWRIFHDSRLVTED